MALMRSGALLLGVVYLGYRLVETGDGANPVLFFLLLAAEAFGVLRFALELSVVGDPRPAVRTPTITEHARGDAIVIVTDEPGSEVRAAVLSAKAVHGVQSVVVADRDDRLDVHDLCARLGIERVAGRSEADVGAVIDEAIALGQSDIVAFVPADTVVLPDVFDVSVDAFRDSHLAVVVSRVEQTNAGHIVDYGGYGADRIRDELMFDVLEEEDALPWWPGFALVRRAALDDIDGMARGRRGVTLATGIRLQAAGWHMTDVPVVVGRRLATWSDDRSLHRWSRELYERLSVLVDGGLPRRNEHASRLSRRVYRLADVQIGRSIQRLLLIGILFATLYVGGLPLSGDLVVIAPLWAAWQGSSYLARRHALRTVGFTPWMVNDLRLLCTDIAVGWRGVRGAPFDTELLGPAPGRRARSVMLIGLQVAIAVTLALFGSGVLRPANGDAATFVALGAALWLWVMLLRARSGLRLHQVRQSFRTLEQLEVYASEGQMLVIGVSPFGVDLVSKRPLTVGSRLHLAFGLPQHGGLTRRVDVAGTVHRTGIEDGQHVSYLRFAHLADDQMDAIIEYSTVIAGMKQLRDEQPAETARRGASERGRRSEAVR